MASFILEQVLNNIDQVLWLRKGKPSRMWFLNEETLRDPAEKPKQWLHSGRAIGGRPEWSDSRERCFGTPKSSQLKGYIWGKAVLPMHKIGTAGCRMTSVI